MHLRVLRQVVHRPRERLGRRLRACQKQTGEPRCVHQRVLRQNQETELDFDEFTGIKWQSSVFRTASDPEGHRSSYRDQFET